LIYRVLFIIYALNSREMCPGDLVLSTGNVVTFLILQQLPACSNGCFSGQFINVTMLHLCSAYKCIYLQSASVQGMSVYSADVHSWCLSPHFGCRWMAAVLFDIVCK